jgi:Asp-tRNA(Asn)/Glu-tRNA(Gln) amidotransferase A subunit family amidase
MQELAFLPITELSRRIEARELDPRDLLNVYLARATGIGRALNCYLALCQDEAQAGAEQAALRAQRKARLGPLDGIPIAIKDNIDVVGLPTSNGFGGAHALAGADAEVVRRLRAHGALILGKLNMQEGALGAVNDNPHHGRTSNPFRDGYTPGGSSGGSAAAVAAGLCAAALGTDTGGSVRIPAAYCGQVGLKPSYGRVSARGVVPLCWRLDHVGPLTRTVSDAALLLAGMAGYDPAWPYARNYQGQDQGVPRAAQANLDRVNLKGVRLGLLGNLRRTAVEPSVEAAFQRALAVLGGLGADLREVMLPSYDVVRGRRAVFVRVEVDAAAVHGPLYQREPDRFSKQMRGYLDWGLRASAIKLAEADRVIDVAGHELSCALAGVDAIVSPTTPQAAFAFAGPVPDSVGDFCVLANMAGCPAISLAMGTNELGLPLGLQLLAAQGQDDRLLAIARAYEAGAGQGLPPPAQFAPG